VEASTLGRVRHAARVTAIRIHFLNSLNRNMKNKISDITLGNNGKIPNCAAPGSASTRG
jgi:hypothetical protein